VAGACTPGAAATTRPPPLAPVPARRRPRRPRRPARDASGLVRRAREHLDTPCSPATPTCSAPSRCTLAHHCWRTSEMLGRRRSLRGPARTGSRSPRSARARSPAPRCPSTAPTPPARWASTAPPATAWTRWARGTARSSSWPPAHRDGAPLAARRGAGAVVVQRVRLRGAGRRLLDGLEPDAAEEEPGRAGAGARQDGPRHRRPGGAAHGGEGAAPHLQPRPAGGQGAALRRARSPRTALPAGRRRSGSPSSSSRPSRRSPAGAPGSPTSTSLRSCAPRARAGCWPRTCEGFSRRSFQGQAELPGARRILRARRRRASTPGVRAEPPGDQSSRRPSSLARHGSCAPGEGRSRAGVACGAAR
jgi:hypothetical protein